MRPAAGPPISQKYEKPKTLLLELFQLDQPDLDFGFYRVMHARSAEVAQFLEKGLLVRLAEDAADLDALEAEAHDHLYSFFHRYYSESPPLLNVRI